MIVFVFKLCSDVDTGSRDGVITCLSVKDRRAHSAVLALVLVLDLAFFSGSIITISNRFFNIFSFSICSSGSNDGIFFVIVLLIL